MNGAPLHREFLELAAARLFEPLAPADEQRLTAHLATCDVCRERVAGYVADRAALRAARELPPPPRDLWARISATLDRERAGPAGWRRRLATVWVLRSGPTGGRRARGALAAALAVLVIVAVVGSGLLPGFLGPFGGIAEATPFEVESRILAYFSTRNGEVGVYMGRIDRVCPEASAANCPSIDSDVRKVASFTDDFVPQRLAVSPDGRTGAVVGTSRSGGAVYALRFPDLAVATPPPTTTASLSPIAGTPGPTTSSEPSADGTATPPTASSEPAPTVEPEAIIEHVIVVGETPAYSADGTMLAFSAMPADHSNGPDIYLWRVGSEAVVALTSDHASIFASWADTTIVGSQAVPADKGSGHAAGPTSFLLDPDTLEVRALARPAWRPNVDPTGRFVIYWDGTLEADQDGLTWHEQRGGLYLAAWQSFDPGAAEPTPEPTAEPAPTQEPLPTDAPGPTGQPTDGSEATAEPPATAPTGLPASPDATPAEPTESATEPPAPPEPSAPQKLEPGRDYLTDPILSWEVRWSPDGEWFGAWIGDLVAGEQPATEGEPGALTVGAVDRTSGTIDRERIELDGAPAVRGFALGDHRIAWTTLSGPGGTSEVRLLVWTENGLNRGIIRTTPGRASNTLPAL